MSTHKIRTTLRPERELDVDDAELTDLSRHGRSSERPNGLVLDTKATTDEGARRAAERQTAASTSNDTKES